MIIRTRKILNQSGFTISEVLVTIVVFSIIGIAIASAFIVGTRVINNNYVQLNIGDDLTQGLELISKVLREAKSIDAFSESSITFTADLGTGDKSYRVYLHSYDDAEPNPPYTQSKYNLRFASGSTTYGHGAVLSGDIQQPASAPFLLNNNLITFDLTAAREDSTVRVRSKVKPRNL